MTIDEFMAELAYISGNFVVTKEGRIRQKFKYFTDKLLCPIVAVYLEKTTVELKNSRAHIAAERLGLSKIDALTIAEAADSPGKLTGYSNALGGLRAETVRQKLLASLGITGND